MDLGPKNKQGRDFPIKRPFQRPRSSFTQQVKSRFSLSLFPPRPPRAVGSSGDTLQNSKENAFAARNNHYSTYDAAYLYLHCITRATGIKGPSYFSMAKRAPILPLLDVAFASPSFVDGLSLSCFLLCNLLFFATIRGQSTLADINCQGTRLHDTSSQITSPSSGTHHNRNPQVVSCTTVCKFWHQAQLSASLSLSPHGGLVAL